MARTGTSNVNGDILPLVVVPDGEEPLEEYLASVSEADRRHSATLPGEKRQRHFLLGRIAARLAIQQVLGTQAQSYDVQVHLGQNGEPLVFLNGQPEIVAVSLSHSSQMVVACAWFAKRRDRFSIGVDIERLRPNEAASSPYAFSRRERGMLAHLSKDMSRVGIAAWSVKEAVWKALRPAPSCGPESIEIRSLNLQTGCASVEVKYELVRQLGNAQIRARLFFVEGTDGSYALSSAITIPSELTSTTCEEMVNIKLVWLKARDLETSLYAGTQSAVIANRRES